MNKDENPKRFDLEDRTFSFAKRVREFVKTLAKTTGNIEDTRQVIRASGSVGANYIEANEAFSKKDFVLRVKICRKEAKESRYWLRLLETSTEQNRQSAGRTRARSTRIDEYFWRHRSQKRVMLLGFEI